MMVKISNIKEILSFYFIPEFALSPANSHILLLESITNSGSHEAIGKIVIWLRAVQGKHQLGTTIQSLFLHLGKLYRSEDSNCFGWHLASIQTLCCEPSREMGYQGY